MHDWNASPLCMQDKILQSMSRGNEVTITNDGATILKSLYVDNPAAKVLVGEWTQPRAAAAAGAAAAWLVHS